MKSIDLLALVLVVIGALNWGLWSVAQFDLVATLFGGNTTEMSRVVYGLVGLAGIYSVKLIAQTARS